MNSFLAIGISFLPVFAVLGLVAWLKKRGLNSEGARKLTHILLSNWILLAMALFEQTWAVCVAPACFVVLNWLSWRRGLFSMIERERGNTPGTVWYAVSLLVLCAAGWGIGMPWLAACGMLAMGYGDGLAALVGLRCGRRRFPGTWKNAGPKTLEGTLAVALFTAIPVFVLVRIYGGGALAASLTGNAGIWPGVAQPAGAAAAEALLARFTFFAALRIALYAAAVAAALELATPRGADNLTLPLGVAATVYIAVTFPGTWPALAALSFSIFLLLAAYYKNALTLPAALAGAALGAALCALGGWPAFGALVLFFILGTLASRAGGARKKEPARLHRRRGPRVTAQVIANGLPGVLFAAIYAATEDTRWLAAALATFAAVCADTFSSEIGMLSRGQPVSILTGKPVARGLSGGVTKLGLLAAAIGALALSLPALPRLGARAALAVFLCGVAASPLDSLLGAALQAKYALPGGGLTERPALDGAPLPLASGLRWMNNDVVNFITALLAGALCAAVN